MPIPNIGIRVSDAPTDVRTVLARYEPNFEELDGQFPRYNGCCVRRGTEQHGYMVSMTRLPQTGNILLLTVSAPTKARTEEVLAEVCEKSGVAFRRLSPALESTVSSLAGMLTLASLAQQG